MKKLDDIHIIRLQKSYYVSLCWYGLKQLGFVQGTTSPGYEDWAKKLSNLGGTFGFHVPMASGPLFSFVYQIPGYLNPKDPSEMRDIMQAGKESLRTDSKDFLNKWPEKTRHWNKWYHSVAREEVRRNFAGQENAACKTLDVWTEYMEFLWPQYSEIYIENLKEYPFEEYEKRCNRLDAFESWRKEFTLEYPYTDFYLVICPENRTVASSLGPEKIVFGAMHSWDTMRHSVVHEIGGRFLGLHLLAENPVTSTIMRKDLLGLLKLLETEVCYRKPRVLPNLKEDGFIKGMNLQALVELRANQKIDRNLVEFFAVLYDKAKQEGLL